MIVQNIDTILEHGSEWADVCVVVPLYNYEKYIVETLDSVAAQDLEDISIIVVDDCSKDSSQAVVNSWMEDNKGRFRRSVLARNKKNTGLSITRNTGISISGSPFIFFLDADNLIYPSCLRRHLSALKYSPEAQGAYSLLEVFDADHGIMGTEVFHPDKFKHGNHIDAMAMVRRQFLLELDGYHDIKYGWEDYDLWLRMCERKEFLIQIPEILGRYRVHHQSMLRTTTNVGKNHVKLKKNIKALHPWLELH